MSHMPLPDPQAAAAPGPRGHFLVGSLPEFTHDLPGTMAHNFALYGDMVRYRVGPRTIFVLSHPELSQEILVERQREFPKFEGKNGLGIVVGNGLIANVDHDSWLTQRRMMQPMFHRKRLAAMGDKLSAAGERMVNRWSTYTPGTTVDVGQEMLQVTLDIITQTMFSADVLGQVGSIGPAVDVGIHYASYKLQNPFTAPASWPTPRNRAYAAAQQTLDRVIYGFINQRRASGEAPGDLLDMLLEARDADTGAQMSDQQIHDEVLTIFAAGHETTANTLTFAWYLLSQYPQVLARLQAEIDTVLQGRTPTVADLPQLPYTQQVFKEAMRLYPAAPIVGPRRVLADTTVGGYSVPAGSRLIVSIYNIHRHPALWEKPLLFNPDRFAPEQSANRHHLAFMPFGAGPRKCIGNNLAEMEGPLLLAFGAQRYELRMQPGQPIETEMAITLRPKDGLQMTLHPRTVQA